MAQHTIVSLFYAKFSQDQGRGVYMTPQTRKCAKIAVFHDGF